MSSKPISCFALLALAVFATGACSDDTTAIDAGRDAGRDARLDGRHDALLVDGLPDAPPVEQGSDAARDLTARLEGGVDLAPCVDPGVDLGGKVRVSPSRLVPGQNVTIRYEGPLAQSGGGVRLHYSYDWWSWQQPSGAPYATAKQVAMTKLASGAYEVTVPLLATAHQLDFVFTDDAAQTWDNNNKADWHRPLGGLWMGPYLTWRDNTALSTPDRDPARAIVVNFASERPCKARVRWGKSAAGLTQQLDEGVATTRHHLLVTQLDPATTYYYEVGCLDPLVACDLFDRSATHSFRTPAATSTPLKVIALSDPQDSGNAQDRWGDLALELSKPPHDDAAFVMISGDLSGDDNPQRWRDFFRKGVPLLATHVLVPAVGNHDTPTFGSNADTSSFEGFFLLGSSSGKDTYHGLRLGDLTVFALNSEKAQSGVGSDWDKDTGAQYLWLAGKLQQPASRWTMAFWHIPPFNAGVRHSGQNDSTRSVLRLFNQRVDWVLGGHEHMYQRSVPIRYSGDSGGKPQFVAAPSYGAGAADGVGYLLAPAAGHYPPEGGLLPAANPLRALLAYPTGAEISNDTIVPWVGYVVLTFNGKTMKIESFELGKSQPRDSVTTTKP